MRVPYNPPLCAILRTAGSWDGGGGRSRRREPLRLLGCLSPVAVPRESLGMRPIEEALYRSGLDFTILQPAMYMQALAGGWRDAVDHGAFPMHYSKDSAMTFVDYRNVAEVAARAFVGDELVGGTFELAAGGMVTRTEIGALISRHAGRTLVARISSPTKHGAACRPVHA